MRKTCLQMCLVSRWDSRFDLSLMLLCAFFKKEWQNVEYRVSQWTRSLLQIRNSTSVKCILSSTFKCNISKNVKMIFQPAPSPSMAFKVIGKEAANFFPQFFIFCNSRFEDGITSFFCEFFLDFLICTDTVQLGEGMESR